MNKDRFVGILFLAVATFFYINTLSLPEETATYSQFIILVLGAFSVVLIISTFIKKGHKEKSKKEKMIDIKRFSIVIVTCLLYVFLVNIIGFLVTSGLYLVATMYFLKANYKTIAISTTSFLLLIYIVFKILLKVPLPTGILI